MSNNDLDLSSQNLVVTQSVAQYTAQKLNARFQFFVGEWFADTREGVPYYQNVYKKNPDLGAIGQMFRSIILDTPGVLQVLSQTMDFYSSSRELDANFVVQANDGSTLEGGPGAPFIVTVDKNAGAA